MFSKKLKLNGKVRKAIKSTTALALAAVVAVSGVSVVHASEITSGTWSLYYNSPASLKTTDYVKVTARSDWTYTAKCNSLSSSSLHIDFTDNPIYPTSDTTLTLTTSAKSKKFKFNTSVCGTVQSVDLKLVRSGSATGSASGSVAKN